MIRRTGFALTGVLIAALAAPAIRSQTRVPKFEVDPAFPSMPAGKLLGDVSSVTVDGRDHVWIIHRPRNVPAEQRANAAPAVLEFEASGKFVNAWGGPGAGYEWPEREHGIHAEGTDAIWISGNNGYSAPGTPPPPGNSDDMLLKFTPAGKFVLQVGHSGKSAGDADHDNVKQAADMVVVRPSNEIFVADGYGNHRVAVFDAKNGKFKRTWGANGGTPFNIVHSIRVANDGLVYVADRGNKRVQVFTSAGDFKQQVDDRRRDAGDADGRRPGVLAGPRAAVPLRRRSRQQRHRHPRPPDAENPGDRRQARRRAGRVRHAARNRGRLEGEHLHGGDQPQQARAEVCV